MPLTDIFARRYKDTVLWERFGENERRLLVQAFRIVSEQLFYHIEHGLWDQFNGTLSMELGVNNLSALSPTDPLKMSQEARIRAATFRSAAACEHFVCAPYDGSTSPDRFVKERLSFIEIAFRKKEGQVAAENANLDQKILDAVLAASRVTTAGPAARVRRLAAARRQAREMEIRAANEKLNQTLESACQELNARFRQAEANLDYHNGFIQLSSDSTTQEQIEQPFWDLLQGPIWRAVDDDMKWALDARDNLRPDAQLHAAKSLESTIKIISDTQGWTQGNETGPGKYLDNLRAKKNGEFIHQWEHDMMRLFFANVRAPSAHGPGATRTPEPTAAQTDWAIEFCMIWIKTLIRRTQP